ncbi:hypothetical protein XELAEV_18002409mg [Xenopus laevis]|nr:hypothetical protein XELAEV_18002409mg [Xenopus laevis]
MSSCVRSKETKVSNHCVSSACQALSNSTSKALQKHRNKNHHWIEKYHQWFKEEEQTKLNRRFIHKLVRLVCFSTKEHLAFLHDHRQYCSLLTTDIG